MACSSKGGKKAPGKKAPPMKNQAPPFTKKKGG